MIREIISINFMVNSWVFKDDESESEAKTNGGPRMCPLLVEGPHFACVEHAQCLLLAHCVSTHTHRYFFLPRWDQFDIKMNNIRSISVRWDPISDLTFPRMYFYFFFFFKHKYATSSASANFSSDLIFLIFHKTYTETVFCEKWERWDSG